MILDDTDSRSESLREFADIIQEKAGPVAGHSPGPDAEPARTPQTSGGMQVLQSTIERQPRSVVAGVGVGIGVALGYLLGKITRQRR